MTSPTILLDPTAERSAASRALTVRPSSMEGLTVGLLDISKARGNVLLDRLDELLSERGIEVKRYRKPTFARICTHGSETTDRQRMRSAGGRPGRLRLLYLVLYA